MTALDGIETTLRRWGVPVLTDDVVAGRPGLFTPTHVMAHHTASNPPAAAPSARVVREGRGDLPGPLCQLLVRRDMKVELVTRGRANHAGLGQWAGIPKDAGNRFCLGIEIEHAGTSAEPWTTAYMSFCRLVEAACLAHLGVPATRLLAHKEYAPSRKIDPYRWEMRSERAVVAGILAAGPSIDDDLIGDLMATKEERDALVRDVAAAAAQAVLNTPVPLMGYVDALYKDADNAMTLAQSAQHAAGQAYAANDTAGAAVDAVAQLRAEVAALRAVLAPPAGP